MSGLIETPEPLSLCTPPRMDAAEQAYQLLKGLIIRLELPPRAVFNEKFLMERLNLGRTPLREALQRLEQENLVVILPRRGILISDISLADFQAAFELRADLEELCGRLAAQRITPEQMDKLEHLFDVVEASSAAFDDVELDHAFHQLVQEAASNRYLVDTLSRLHDQTLRLQYLMKSRMARVRDDFDNYLKVINALKSRDAQAAGAALRAHSDTLYERARGSF